MNELQRVATSLNLLGKYLGIRDVADLTTIKVDVLVLYGGSILQGADEFAKAYQKGVAKYYVLSGGHGHTTKYLRASLEKRGYQGLEHLSEAQMLALYLQKEYDITITLLENASTNCGNNVTCVLELLEQHQINFESLALIQDATLQKRMAACFAKYLPNKKIINYAAYQTEVGVKNADLICINQPNGMWTLEHYSKLLLGEIVRLHDTKEGYGPNGKNFIAHVAVPQDVLLAYRFLSQYLGYTTRQANQAYQTTNLGYIHKQIIKEYFSMWVKRDFKRLPELFSKDCRYEECYGPIYENLHQIKAWVTDTLLRQKVLSWQIKAFYHSKSNQVFVEWNFSAQEAGKIASFDGLSLIGFDDRQQISLVKEFEAKLVRTYPYRKKSC